MFQSFKIHIQDTNNNKPQFLPTDNYDIKVFTPLPANFPITTIFQPIIVKDIDLTTYSIRPEIEDNEFFDLKYEDRHTVPKQFKLLLVTKKPIFPHIFPITLKIKAFVRTYTFLIDNRILIWGHLVPYSACYYAYIFF